MVYISLESKHVTTNVESIKSRDVQNVNCIVSGRKLNVFWGLNSYLELLLLFRTVHLFCYGCNYLNRRLSFKWPFQTDGNAGLLIDVELVPFHVCVTLLSVLLFLTLNRVALVKHSSSRNNEFFLIVRKFCSLKFLNLDPTELYRPDLKTLVEYSTFGLSKQFLSVCHKVICNGYVDI
jgi:hypothetical protein